MTERATHMAVRNDPGAERTATLDAGRNLAPDGLAASAAIALTMVR